MKKIISFILFIFFNSAVFADFYLDDVQIKKGQKLLVWLDKVRIRQNSELKSSVIGFLKDGDVVEFTGQISRNSLKTKLRGRVFNDYFFKIKAKNKKAGWVYGGALIDSKYGLSKKIKILGSSDSEYRRIKLKLKNWYGLFKEKNNYSVKKIKLRAKPGTSGGEAFTTTSVSTNFGNAVLLINNLKTIKEGNVKTVRKLSKLQKLKGNSNLSFFFNKNKYKLFMKSISTGFAYILKKIDKNKIEIKQIVITSTPEKIRLIWAGDIDNDGLLDLILDYDSDKGPWGDISLFLSGKAKKGRLIKLIDQTNSWSSN